MCVKIGKNTCDFYGGTCHKTHSVKKHVPFSLQAFEQTIPKSPDLSFLPPSDQHLTTQPIQAQDNTQPEGGADNNTQPEGGADNNTQPEGGADNNTQPEGGADNIQDGVQTVYNRQSGDLCHDQPVQESKAPSTFDAGTIQLKIIHCLSKV